MGIKGWGEEYWTNDMMDTIIDFEETGVQAPAKKPKNKIERKKLKRQQRLEVRRAATGTERSATPGGAVPLKLAGKTEPEEEPRPRKKLKKRLVSQEETIEAAPGKKRKVVVKKKKK